MAAMTGKVQPLVQVITALSSKMGAGMLPLCVSVCVYLFHTARGDDYEVYPTELEWL